jgi:hypothetical protein
VLGWIVFQKFSRKEAIVSAVGHYLATNSHMRKEKKGKK